MTRVPSSAKRLPCRGGGIATGFSRTYHQHYGPCYARQDTGIGRLQHGGRVDENLIELFAEPLKKPWEASGVKKMRDAAGGVSRRQNIQARVSVLYGSLAGGKMPAEDLHSKDRRGPPDFQCRNLMQARAPQITINQEHPLARFSHWEAKIANYRGLSFSRARTGNHESD